MCMVLTRSYELCGLADNVLELCTSYCKHIGRLHFVNHVCHLCQHTSCPWMWDGRLLLLLLVYHFLRRIVCWQVIVSIVRWQVL